MLLQIIFFIFALERIFLAKPERVEQELYFVVSNCHLVECELLVDL